MIQDIVMDYADGEWDFTIEEGDIALNRGVDVLRAEIRTIMLGPGAFTGDLRIGSTIARATASQRSLWRARVHNAFRPALDIMENVEAYEISTDLATRTVGVAFKSALTKEGVEYVHA